MSYSDSLFASKYSFEAITPILFEMSTYTSRVISFICVLGAVGLTFQNCSDVNFAPVDQSSGSFPDLGLDPVLGEVPLPTPTQMVCPPGYVEVDGQCEMVQTAFTDCERFEDLGDRTEIPSLALTGTCYYKKVVNASTNAASGSRGEITANDVIARRHGTTGDTRPNIQDYQGAANPFVIGDSGVLNLNFLGARSLSLTSSAVADESEIANKGMDVDNFMLVNIVGEAASHVLARGTMDSKISSSQPMVYRPGGNIPDVPVTDFISYASGGTAQIGVLSLNGSGQSFANFTGAVDLRIRMLDCGGSAQSSDVFLIIH